MYNQYLIDLEEAKQRAKKPHAIQDPEYEKEEGQQPTEDSYHDPEFDDYWNEHAPDPSTVPVDEVFIPSAGSMGEDDWREV